MGILIGLTGGIASGKSTVARLLESKGAVVIDADEIAREVVRPGHTAHEQIVAEFGSEILTEAGEIDRAKLGRLVFADEDKRKALEAITHPEIYREILERIEAHRGGSRLIVLDAALLVETMPDRGKMMGLDALVVVTSNAEDQIERMIRDREMHEQDARSRISAQASQERKMAAADYVIDNRGDMGSLEKSVEILYDDLMATHDVESGGPRG